MKSLKKSVSFRIEDCGDEAQNVPMHQRRPLELGSTYEKRYFQAMLARLSQPRPKTSGFCRTSPFHEEPPRRRPQSGADIFSQRSKKPAAVPSLFEKRRRKRVSSVSSSASPATSLSSSSSSSSSSSPSCSSQLEVVGVRTAMTSRRTPSPSLFYAGSATPHHGLASSKKISRSREILHRIQSELSQAKDRFSSDRALGSQVPRPLSRSLNEISNLVMELDNNLCVEPSQDDGVVGSGQGNRVHDGAGRRDPPEVKAESLQYIGKIGRGCFAHVFRAKLFETAVAVKEFKEDDAGNGRRRCLREAEMLSRIRHPNVANLVAVCIEKNAIVLELVDGEALGAKLTRDKLLEGSNILTVCRDVLLALHYLHNLYPDPVIHLDVKSNNVLISGVGRGAVTAKLCDFGSAKRLSGGKSEILLGGVAGTPAWMSPEVIEQAHVGVKADVYSFGVMLWEMVSGEVPYDGMELQDVCGSICRGDHLASRPDFDARLPGICALMERCWSLRPSARPDCGRLMDELAEIQDVLDLRSVPSPPPLPPPPIPHAIPQMQTGSPEEKRSSASAMGFSVTREDLEAQRLRLRRPPDEHEAEVEATSASLLSHVMKKAIRERRTDSGWGQQDSSNAGDSRSSVCQSPWTVSEDTHDDDESDDPSSR